jgi:hypothetical protein
MSTRKSLRAYVVNLLKTPSGSVYPTNAESRVFNSRIIPVGEWNNIALPTINVATPRETVEGTFHVCTMDIELAVKGSTFADDLDTLAAQVINKLDYTLGGNVFKCVYQGFEGTYFDEVERPMGVGRLTFQLEYQYEELLVDPDDLPNLENINLQWDMYSPNDGSVIGPDGQIDAEDNLTNLHS